MSILVACTAIDAESNHYLHSTTVPKKYSGYLYYGIIRENSARLRAIPIGNAVLDPLFHIETVILEGKYRTTISVYPSVYACIFNFMGILSFLAIMYYHQNAFDVMLYSGCLIVAYLAELILVYKKSKKTVSQFEKYIVLSQGDASDDCSE